MNEITQTAESQVCQSCAEDSEARTMYVHLCSGKVQEVAGVTVIEVTPAQIVLQRGEEEPAVFTRRDVYFACCDADQQPSPS